jgi:hypothetical protein
MNGSIISLIQENRRLFYRGELRNSYKDRPENRNTTTESSKSGSLNEVGIKEKSFRFLQEIFNE